MADKSQVFDVSVEDIVDFCQKHYKLILGVSLTVVGIKGLRKYFSGGVCHSHVKLEGKTVVITGGNTGIGKETAKDLARRGARVILACRDLTKAERAAADIRQISGNNNVHTRVLDLASLKSVRKFCDEIKKSESRLDILINNAGVMACPQWKSEDGYDLQFAVNHLGHFLLTNELLDLLKQSAPSRIVNVSSLAHEKGTINVDDVNYERTPYKSWVAYRQSKLANVLFTRELHKRFHGSGISTFALHPGIVKTELSRHIMPTIPMYQTLLWRFFIGPLIMKNAKQGAQTSIYCAVTEGLESESGKYFSDCVVKEPSAAAKSDEMASKLWQLTLQMAKL